MSWFCTWHFSKICLGIGSENQDLWRNGSIVVEDEAEIYVPSSKTCRYFVVDLRDPRCQKFFKRLLEPENWSLTGVLLPKRSTWFHLISQLLRLDPFSCAARRISQCLGRGFKRGLVSFGKWLDHVGSTWVPIFENKAVISYGLNNLLSYCLTALYFSIFLRTLLRSP
jgi:hypothetical protein